MRTTPLIAAATSGTALVLASAGAAGAADPPVVDQWRLAETAALVSWVEVDHEDATGRPGTVHIGGLFLTLGPGGTDVFAGSLADWDCPPGALPADEDAPCTLLTQYETSGGDVDMVFDRKSGTAHVTGTVTFFDTAQQEPDVWSVPVDLHWTTEGKPVPTQEHVVELSPSAKFIAHTRTTTWAAVHVQGTVGTMVLGDEEGELNEEWLWHAAQRFVVWVRGSDEPPDDGGGMG